MDTHTVDGKIDGYTLIAGLLEHLAYSDYSPEVVRNIVRNCVEALSTSIFIPCPSCNELIPLVLDEELIHFMLESMLKNASDLSDAKMLNKEAIREKLIADSGAHPISCKGLHGPGCRIDTGDFITLENLLGGQ